MRHAITCKICNRAEIVNGQAQIDEFKARHQHGQSYTEYITGKEVNYGVQLNNTTLEIEALPNLAVDIKGYRAMYEALKSMEYLLLHQLPTFGQTTAYMKCQQALTQAEGK